MNVMNLTNYNSTRIENNDSNSLFYQISIIGVLSTIDLTTLIGNFLVIIAVMTTKSLHTVTNSFIVSLAVADMLVAILVLPLSIYMVVYNNWIFGNITCDLWISCDVMLCTASILNLCCISLDRYFAITRPLAYSRQRSPKLARTMIAIVWIGSVLISCPPVFGWRDKNRKEFTCSLNLLLSYRIYSSIGSFYLPCLIMIFVYLRIFRVIHNREKYLTKSSNNTNTFSFMVLNKTEKKTIRFKKKSQQQIDEDDEEEDEEDENTFNNDSSLNQQTEDQKLKNHSKKNFNKISILSNTSSSNFSSYSTSLNLAKPSSIKKFKSKTKKNNPICLTKSNSFVGKKLANETNHQDSMKLNTNKKNKGLSLSSISSLNNNKNKPSRNQEQIRMLKESKAAKTLAIVVGGFIACWLPFFIMYVIEALLPPSTISKALYDWITWLGYINSAINPFIYAFCSKQFRSAFYRITLGNLRSTKNINNIMLKNQFYYCSATINNQNNVYNNFKSQSNICNNYSFNNLNNTNLKKSNLGKF